MITKICETCEKEYEVFNCRAITSKYCSKECFVGRFIDSKIELECSNCKKKYKVSPSRKHTSRYCSRKCMKSRINKSRIKKSNPRFNFLKEDIEEIKERLLRKEKERKKQGLKPRHYT